ncbi:MAG: ABC transporter permease [Actinomycetaceae bacterium]|nr:ABC transporter permease [Actinomycetaceae bacterium]
MNSILSALIEAWGEIKINKGRFILSLIGVGVAVWAMATVLALGGMLTATDEYFRTISGDRPGAVVLSAYPQGEQSSTVYGRAPWETGPDTFGNKIELVEDENGNLTSKFGAAARATATALEVTNWTREVIVQPEIRTANWSSACDPNDEGCWNNWVNLNGVDPVYLEFFARNIVHGRNLTDADALLQMNPAVITESLWKVMGSPSLESRPQILVSGDPGLTLTVVGVAQSLTEWEGHQIYMHYDGLMASQPRLKNAELDSSLLRILAPVGEEENASKVAQATLQSELGPGFEVESYYSMADWDAAQNEQAIITTIVSVIGGIVILLGAFGLLTVSIVTIRQRIREIGIRRAMGASARRVFFSVFLESVVATTAAGIVGVMLSIFTIRFMPQGVMDMPISLDTIPYPMSAALLGVLIAAGVGALAGIIPATIAVRVKPIDAIRF